MSVLVEFHGERFWYLGDSLEDLGHALAYLDHCDDSGEVLWSKVLEASYAHVYKDGSIKRYKECIGTVADLVPVKPTLQ